MRMLILIVAVLIVAAAGLGLNRGQHMPSASDRPGSMRAEAGSPAPPAPASASADRLQQALGAGEVVDADGKPVPAGSFPKKKLTFIYFSAKWCGPCHAFTPTLVKFYQDAGAARPFDLIMVSDDRSAGELKAYAEEMHMPWPFAKREGALAQGLQRDYAGDGIPDLVLVDADGKVLSDSFAGREYRGPQAVLDDYAKLQH